MHTHESVVMNAWALYLHKQNHSSNHDRTQQTLFQIPIKPVGSQPTRVYYKTETYSPTPRFVQKLIRALVVSSTTRTTTASFSSHQPRPKFLQVARRYFIPFSGATSAAEGAATPQMVATAVFFGRCLLTRRFSTTALQHSSNKRIECPKSTIRRQQMA